MTNNTQLSVKPSLDGKPLLGNAGALVISLDFELHWGVRDHKTISGSYRANLLGARRAVPALLALFRRFDIAATWATVGFLFAESKAELESYYPPVRPNYHNPRLDPYQEQVGQSETDDPFHYAPSLIRLIQQTPRQELATHTFSHYYCIEPGQDCAAFQADLQSAIAIARAKGVQVTSIIFPRNQHNPHYSEILLNHGICCYRGNERGWMHQAALDYKTSRLKRLLRLADAYLNLFGQPVSGWSQIVQSAPFYNVPGSFFLRPYLPRLRWLEPLREQRLKACLRRAAETNQIVHLWWHPHNFGVYLEENLAVLRRLLIYFQQLRDRLSMASLTMAETACRAAWASPQSEN
jgi:hypothetical protein